MDWSPPPSKWDWRNTVWPHDHRTGWSYCVTIPSWILLPKSRVSEPIVFYRGQIGLQSPEGVAATHGVLRRFSDFLKLYNERRCFLEDWMEKLWSDIDLSRTATVAYFAELEAAARSAFNTINKENSGWNSYTTDVYPSVAFPPASDASVGATSPSIMSDNGNDLAYDVSELGTPRLAQSISVDFGIETSEHELDNRKDTLKYGIFIRNFIFNNIEKYSRRKAHSGGVGTNVSGTKVSDDTFGIIYQDEEVPSEADSFKPNNHARRLATESVGSNLGSIRASEVSNFSTPNLFADNSLDHPEDSEAVITVDPISSVSRM